MKGLLSRRLACGSATLILLYYGAVVRTAESNTSHDPSQRELARKLLAITSDKLSKHLDEVIPNIQQPIVEDIGPWQIEFGPGKIKMPQLRDVELKPQTSGDVPFVGEIEVHYLRPATQKVKTDGSLVAIKRLGDFFAHPQYVHKIEYVVEMVFEYRDGKWQQLPQDESNRLTSIPVGTVLIQRSENVDSAITTLLADE